MKICSVQYSEELWEIRTNALLIRDVFWNEVLGIQARNIKFSESSMNDQKSIMMSFVGLLHERDSKT